MQAYFVFQARDNAELHYDEGISAAESLVDSIIKADYSIESVELNAKEVKDLRSNPRVLAFAKPFSISKVGTLKAQPATTESNDSWALNAIGATNSNLDGSGVKVALLDSGVNVGLEVFDGLSYVPRNFTHSGSDTNIEDFSGHGTLSASVFFGAKLNGKQIGAAPNLEEALIAKVVSESDRTMNDTSEGLIRALDWVLQHEVDVVSTSIGLEPLDYYAYLVNDKEHEPKEALAATLYDYLENVRMIEKVLRVRKQLRSKNMPLICAATGNDSRRMRYRIPANAPASIAEIVGVGALTTTGGSNTRYKVLHTSNTECNCVAPGASVIGAGRDGGQIYGHGTSIATPLVAGVATLWAQKLKHEPGNFPSKNLKNALLTSCSIDQIENPDETDVGRGLIMAPR